MRRKLKKLGCAILCTCLLIINTPGSMSYAENTEQYATDTDAIYADTVDTDVTENAYAATGTDALPSATAGDAEDIYASSVTATDVLLYASATIGDVMLNAASPDVPEGGYSIEINSQDDWDNLFNHTEGDGSGWTNSSGAAVYIEDKNPVVIILNADITLSKDTVLMIPTIESVKKDFLLYGNGHSIDLGGYAFMFQAATTVTIENTHIKNGTIQVQNATTVTIENTHIENGTVQVYGATTVTIEQQTHIENGTVQVYGHMSFNCTDSQFSSASVELYTSDATGNADITGCDFSECSGPCVYSKGAPCPVNFSDCIMDKSGLLFKSMSTCSVSFSGIKATNCTGTVFGQGPSESEGSPYIIKSISGCELSTSETGITAIDQYATGIGEITGCKIIGFDTGINLSHINNIPALSGTDTLKIDDIKISDCITGVDIQYLSGYNKAMISKLTMEARDDSNTVGFKCWDRLQNASVADYYDLKSMPYIKGCTINNFDTGIDLTQCQAYISDCVISDCKEGINTIASNPVAIVDTTLTARASVADSIGVTAERSTCFLIDCEINDFDIGSNMDGSQNNATIINCSYQSKDTNLICAGYTSVYDTSFIGGKTSVSMDYSYSYFYDCVVKGEPGVTTSGFSARNNSKLYIYSLARPYHSRSDGYDKLKEYSKKTKNEDDERKSEIFYCEIGVVCPNQMYIADTYIHDCGTGIKSTNYTYSYGNNLIEKCQYGMEVSQFYKETDNQSPTTTLDTIRNCSEDGFLSTYAIYSHPQGWENRLEIYECGNYGIKTSGSITSVTVDVHDCKTGIYTTETASLAILDSGSKIYDNEEWNVYNDSSQLIFQGSETTLTGGGEGNIYFGSSPSENKSVRINTQTLYSDDSVYFLGSDTGFYIFGDTFKNLDGTVVFDTVPDGYTIGRKVAELKTDVTSQMFAKKEGFVILAEPGEYDSIYAVFAAGCDVTYDVTTNGGDTFDGEKLSNEEIKDGKRKRISYLKGDPVDLTYTASKTDYEFVGWNTDKDAKVGLDTLTAETEDITLYAIYKKTVDINYHTYDAASDYKTAVTFYNNEDEEIEHRLATYNAGGDNTFAGYVLNENADVSSADDLLKAGDNVTVSLDGLDVYCVYSKQGQLKYLKKDGTTLSTESKTVYQICADNKEFEYTVRAGEPVTGFTFIEWKDEDDNRYAAGATISTMESSIVLTPVYEENEEPTTEDSTTEEPTTEEPTTEPPTTEDSTTEEPTTETPTTEDSTTETPTTEEPTTEEPTTEASTAEDPIIQPPTTEASTTETPSAGPVTGDSTNPIGVIGFGMLSLLGILGLTMKNKKKN